MYGINQKDDFMKLVPLLFVLIYFPATWIAVKEVFSDARVQGCSFTGDRRWWGSVADLGLKTAYEEWQEVDRLIRKLLALPYLPPGQIRGAFVNLRQFDNTPPLRQLLQYVEETSMYVESARGLCFDWRLGLTTMLKVHIFSMTNVYAILSMFNKFFNNLKKKICLLCRYLLIHAFWQFENLFTISKLWVFKADIVGWLERLGSPNYSSTSWFPCLWRKPAS